MLTFKYLPVIVPGLALTMAALLAEEPARLGEALRVPDGFKANSVPSPASGGGGYTVNISSREEVRNFYNTIYESSEGVPAEWTGNVATCTPATTSSAFRDANLRRINYHRAMAGVPANVVFSAEYNRKAQQAALMMSANNSLSHAPPTSWACFTAEGSEAAGSANLSLGNAGAAATDGQMRDNGSGNAVVGHRRWLLYPQTRVMGSGDVTQTGANSAANANWVFDGNIGTARPTTRHEYVSWPPPGFVPYQIVPARWSFAYDDATFNSATVTMSSNGVSIPVRLETVANGYGENTLVWVPANLDANTSSTKWPRPANDTVFAVILQNVMINGSPRSFSYNVTVIDPRVPGPDTVLPVISGPAQPLIGQGNIYTFAAVSNATGYQWRQTQRSPAQITDGAENGFLNFTNPLPANYSVISTTVRHSGNNSFHLAHSPATPQLLELKRTLLANTNSQVEFRSRLRLASADEIARVQVSTTEGATWQDIYVQPGAGVNQPGETVFTAKSIPLGEFAGKAVRVRFNFDFGSGQYYDASDSTGWFVDDITVVNFEEVSNPIITSVPSGTTFSFTPAAIGEYGLEVRAQLFGEYFLEWGPASSVTAVAGGSPVLTVVGRPTLAAGQFQFEFDVVNYRAGMTFQVEQKSTISETWAVDASATVQPVIPNSRFRATTSAGGGMTRFYRAAGR